MPIFPSLAQIKNRYRPYANYMIGTALSGRPPYGPKTSPGQYMYAGGQDGSVVYKRGTRKKRKSSLRTKIADLKEAKHLTNSQAFDVLHSTGYAMCPTAAILQGDAIANRDGDSITLAALKLNGSFDAPTASNGYEFRVIVGYTREVGVTTTFTSSLGSTAVFLPNTATGELTNGIINPKLFTCLYDERHTVNSLLTGVRDRCLFDVKVNLNNMRFDYAQPGGTTGKFKNLVVYVMADAIGGVVGVTNTGGFNLSWDLIFKDL